MKKLSLVVFVFFTLSSISYGLELKIAQYVMEIDHSGKEINEIISEAKVDTSSYIIYGYEYSTLEYLITGILLSGNSMDCRRLMFVEQSLKFLDVQAANNRFKAIYYFIIGDKEEFYQVIDDAEMKDSFLESLCLTIEIRLFDFSDDYKTFLAQVESFISSYNSIPNTANSFRLSLPVVELLSVWNQKFPQKFDRNAEKFLKNALKSTLDFFVLCNYVSLVANYKPNCRSMYYLDCMKWCFSTSRPIGVVEFQTDKKRSGYLYGVRQKDN